MLRQSLRLALSAFDLLAVPHRRLSNPALNSKWRTSRSGANSPSCIARWSGRNSPQQIHSYGRGSAVFGTLAICLGHR